MPDESEECRTESSYDIVSQQATTTREPTATATTIITPSNIAATQGTLLQPIEEEMPDKYEELWNAGFAPAKDWKTYMYNPFLTTYAKEKAQSAPGHTDSHGGTATT